MRYIKIFLYTLALIPVLVFGLAYLLPVTQEENHHEKIFPNSAYITLNGTELHYRIWQPDTIRGHAVLIHGFSGHSYSWRKNIDTLVNSGFKVIAADVPPFGFSSKQEGINHSSSANAHLIWKLLDTIGGNKWNIIGHSMGAAIAGAMAAIHPEKTEKLVMVDGIFEGTKKQNKASLTGKLLSSGPFKQLSEAASKNYFCRYNKFKDLLESAYGSAADSLEVMAYLKPFQYKNTASCIMEFGRSVEVNDLNAEDIQCPTLLIWGVNDSWIPLYNGEKYVKLHPKAKLALIKNGGHCPMETRAYEFNSRIIDFLK